MDDATQRRCSAGAVCKGNKGFARFGGENVRQAAARPPDALPPPQRKSETEVEPFVGDNTFYIPATPEILGSISRVKVPRQMGCSMRDWSDYQQRQQREKARGTRSHGAELPRLTMEEVMAHATPDDLWLVVRGVVYDCTKFQRFHPGGERILRQCAGRDCTALYDHFHSWVSCEGLMAPFAVGIVDAQSPK
ncbi:putative cytochrome b [Trypanosoma conorhini]|uniref:Putative cytochrome b n=1 Tax=Trypanosoma conorhini TaxID=83891 RepID=A0A3R7KXH9_9TRYP|nr:putative cytochrome b [Trypanosoma conorhini]RNF17086.1 putative cytochrome b [Trypanosoma conorhini]